MPKGRLKCLFKRQSIILIVVSIVLIFVVLTKYLHCSSLKIQNVESMNVQFQNVQSEKIKSAFIEVLERYESLKDYKIILRQQQVKSATMMAQPIFNFTSFFGGVKSYKVKLGIYVRDSDTLKVDQMSKNVLIGWFAHELGHIVDYAPYSNWRMIQYGFKYLTSEKFMRDVEYTADLIAIEHGFTTEIIAAKRYIMENDLMEQKYKDKISKYYMSIEDVIMCAEDKAVAKPKPELSTN